MLPEALTAETILRAVTYLVAMLLSLSFHEAAHALAASLKGDDTAKSEGRLTLNPMAHIDPIGTILLPLIGALASLPVIGWAKPVPVRLAGLKNPRMANLQVSLAGPASNLLLAFVCLAAVMVHQATGVPEKGTLLYPFIDLLVAMVTVNVFLAFFNLIPIPPLDGAAMITSLLPIRWAEKYEEHVAPYGYFILLMIVISGGLHWLPAVSQAYLAAAASVLRLFFGS